MFLYVDPYGRPLNETLSLSDGSSLVPFNPEPIDLVNVAAPNLNQKVSSKSKPQPTRRWPEQIDRQSLEKDGSEFRLINVEDLRFEDFDDDDFDEDEELEKVEPIKIHRREREDEGKFQLPKKRFPVFPLLNVPNNSDKQALPINWNFQFSQVQKIGNYKYVKQTNQPLKQLIDQLNSSIK